MYNEVELKIERVYGPGYRSSATELNLGLGSGATIEVQTNAVPGDVIQINAGAIYAAAGNSDAVAAGSGAAGTVKLPASGLEPLTAALSVPPVLGPCNGAVLDASDSRGPGRSLTFAFSVTSSNADVSAAVTSLAAASSSAAVVAVPAADIPTGAELAFAVTVTDWLGRSATATATARKAETPALGVVITGPASLSIVSGAPLSLEALAGSPSGSCLPGGGSGMTDAVTFVWSVTGDAGTVSLTEAVAARPTLAVAASVLRAGATYHVTVTAFTTADATPATAVVVVTILAPPLAVDGSLGPDRAAPSDAPLTITAVPYDPAEARDSLGEAYPFIYEWACALQVGGQDCFTSGSAGAGALLQGSSGSVTFPSNTLVVGAAHVFTAMVSRLPLATGRSGAVATVTITAVPPPATATAAGTPPPYLAPSNVLPPPTDVALLTAAPDTPTARIMPAAAVTAVTIIAAGGARTEVDIVAAKDSDADADALVITIPGAGASLLIRTRPGATTAVTITGVLAEGSTATAPAATSVLVPSASVQVEFAVPLGSMAIHLPLPAGVTSVSVVSSGAGGAPVTVDVPAEATAVTVPIPTGATSVSIQVPVLDPTTYIPPTTVYIIQPLFPAVTAQTLGSEAGGSLEIHTQPTLNRRTIDEASSRDCKMIHPEGMVISHARISVHVLVLSDPPPRFRPRLLFLATGRWWWSVRFQACHLALPPLTWRTAGASLATRRCQVASRRCSINCTAWRLRQLARYQ